MDTTPTPEPSAPAGRVDRAASSATVPLFGTVPLPEKTQVLIVGGGLAGLAAARVTTAAGLATVVLEAGDEVGRVRTDVVDGFQLDRGFQILLTAYPEVVGQLDLGALQLGRFAPGARVWLGEDFARVADPFRQPSAALATLGAPIGSLADKVRLARLRHELVTTSAAALLRRGDGTTIDALIARGFSVAMIERFWRPLFAGIQLDETLHTSRRMFDLIFRTLVMGDAAVPAAGMGAVPRQLAVSLPAGTVHTGVAVERLTGTEAGLVDGGRVEAEVVLVATDGPNAARLLGLAPVGSKAASCVWFAAAEAPVAGPVLLLDGTGQGPARNVAVLSNVAPSYAPPGYALLAAAVPGRADPTLEGEVRAQMRGWFGPVVDTWRALRTDAIAHGQPHQGLHHSLKQAVFLGSGRYVCGDHRDTASLQGALFSGRRAGERIVADLRRGTRPISR